FSQFFTQQFKNALTLSQHVIFFFTIYRAYHSVSSPLLGLFSERMPASLYQALCQTEKMIYYTVKSAGRSA
ncbi:MAG: hypothetical protein PHG06_23440, partial [Parabacteroides sp.]|nr:hypothetical protein [Parabacteroides sp.]